VDRGPLGTYPRPHAPFSARIEKKIFLKVPENLRFFHLFLAHFEADVRFYVGDGLARHVRWIATGLSYRLRYKTFFYGPGKYKRARAAQSHFFAKKTVKSWAWGQTHIFFYSAYFDVFSKVVGLDELRINIAKNSIF
jgi:hypothetical protein